MLKTRIIPTLLMKDTGLVKGSGFDSWRRVGTALPAIRVYNRRQVDELIVLDVSASVNNRPPDFEEIRHFSSDCFVPLTVGGGIRGLDDIKSLLRAGADKVSINTAAYTDPDLITKAAERFGSQCIVVSIDARKNPDGSYSCYSHCGKEKEDTDPVSFAKIAEEKGAGEILITGIEHEGKMEGYDLELIRQVSSAVKIPVIASGGAGNFEDFKAAIDTGGAQAVAAASIFHFTEKTPLEVKNHLSECGIPTRAFF